MNRLDALGYYQVRDRKIQNKIPALIYGTQIDVHPEWIFNNQVFDQFDWTREPGESLDELYRQRAQQLRDRYDWVTLCYSAGSDSQNILNAFIRNNIRLDEVVVIWAIGQAEKRSTNAHDTSHENVLSEWELTIKPQLRWLADNHPNIRITVKDWAERLHEVDQSAEYLLTRNHMFCVYADHRWDLDDVYAPVEKKNGVIVYGLDKPRICINNDAYCLYFLDAAAHSALPTSLDHQSQVELFYWSPDACKIMAKQAHAIVQFFELNPQFQKYITWPNITAQAKQFYDTVVKAIIYPSVNLDMFQANKPTSAIVGHGDLIVVGTELETSLNKICDSFSSVLQGTIDQKYFHNYGKDLTVKGFINGMWKIKSIKKESI